MYKFLYERHFGSFYYVHVTRKKLPKQHLYKKIACLKLMKLTVGQASQTGGPRAACGPIACFMRPQKYFHFAPLNQLTYFLYLLLKFI